MFKKKSEILHLAIFKRQSPLLRPEHKFIQIIYKNPNVLYSIVDVCIISKYLYMRGYR